MKLIEMAMTTGSVVAPPSFARKKKKRKGRKNGRKKEQVRNAGRRADTGAVEESMDTADRHVRKS